MSTTLNEQINDIILEYEYNVIQSMLSIESKNETMSLYSESFVQESDDETQQKKPGIIKRLIKWIKDAITNLFNKIKSLFTGKKKTDEIITDVDVDALNDTTKNAEEVTKKSVKAYKKVLYAIGAALGVGLAAGGTAVAIKHHNAKSSNVNSIPKPEEQQQNAENIKKPKDVENAIKQLRDNIDDLTTKPKVSIQTITFETFDIMETAMRSLSGQMDELSELYDTCEILLSKSKDKNHDVLTGCKNDIETLIKSLSNIISEYSRLIIDYNDLERQMHDAVTYPTKFKRNNHTSYMFEVKKLDKPHTKDYLLILHNKVGKDHMFASIEYRYQFQINSMIYNSLKPELQKVYPENSYVEITLGQKENNGIKSMNEVKIPLVQSVDIVNMVTLKRTVNALQNIDLHYIKFNEKKRASQKDETK